MPMAQRRDQANWSQLATGSFGEQNLPSSFTLPDEVKKGVDVAYQRSIDSGFYERGGNIVKNWGSGHSVRHGGTTYDDVNDKNTWGPDEDDRGPGQKIVGDIHSHAYEDGIEGTFSDSDVAGMTDSVGRMSIARSGAQTFMLAKTREFDARVKAIEDDPDFESSHERMLELKRQMHDAYNTAFKAAKGTHAQKLEAAVRATSARFDLGYYKGAGAKLDRVGE